MTKTGLRTYTYSVQVSTHSGAHSFETLQTHPTLVVPPPVSIPFTKKTITMKKFLWVLIPVCLVMSTIFVSLNSCQSGDKKTLKDSTSVSQGEDTAMQRAAGVQTLSTVRLTKQNLMDLFQIASGDNEIKMIYFKFRIDGNVVSLSANGANKEGQAETGLFDLAAASNGPTLSASISNHDYEQQLTRGNIKAYLNLPPENVPIRSSELVDSIWLVPCWTTDTTGEPLIYYMGVVPGTQIDCPAQRPQAGRQLMSSNPSPPAKPCYDECDSPQFSKKYTKKELLDKK